MSPARRPYFSEYVRKGMLRFVSGQYAGAVRNGGMLAFVLDADLAAAIAGVRGNIQAAQAELGMSSPADFSPSSIRGTDSWVRETYHRRTHTPELFTLHHLFMAGDPNAPLLPEVSADSATTNKKAKRKTPKLSRQDD